MLAIATATQAGQPGDKAMAESLFQAGKELMDQGRYAEACPKFAASFRIERAVGSLLNLARCHELEGKTATAWAEYREAAAMAQSLGQKDRADGALTFASALDKRLSRLTIEVREPVEGMKVTRSSVVVGPDAWGVPVAIDPGRYDLEASAPGYRRWTTSFEVGADGGQDVVVVPALVRADAAGGDPQGRDEAASDQGSTTYFVLAGVATSIAVVGGVLTGVYGARASSTWDEAQTKCPEPERECDAKGVELSEKASGEATVSTVGLVVGLVGLAGAAVLWGLGASAGSDAADEPAPTAIRVVPVALPNAGAISVVGEF